MSFVAAAAPGASPAAGGGGERRPGPALRSRLYLSNTASFVVCCLSCPGSPCFATLFATFEERLRQTSSVRHLLPSDSQNQSAPPWRQAQLEVVEQRAEGVGDGPAVDYPLKDKKESLQTITRLKFVISTLK